jgi:ectoine hydroxylase-related dioxygenase (phytanoyl-CoA dioxygenase family)
VPRIAAEVAVDFYAPDAGIQLRHSLKHDGFCRVRGAFSLTEVGALRDALEALIASSPAEPGLTWRSPAKGGGTVVQRISRANRHSQAFVTGVIEAPKLATIGGWSFGCGPEEISVADGLEGSDGVVAVIKDPRNASEHAALRWHRDDRFTTHLAINPFVNCGIYLDSSDERSGALVAVPRDRPFPASAGETTDQVPHARIVPAAVGDVVVHSSDVWHRSGPAFAEGHRRRVVYGNVFRRAS